MLSALIEALDVAYGLRILLSGPGRGQAQLFTTAVYADAVGAEEKCVACSMRG